MQDWNEPEATMFRRYSAKPTSLGRRARPFLQAALLMLFFTLIWRYWAHGAFLAWKNNAGPVPFFIALAGVPFPIFFGLSLAISGLYAAGLIVFGESAFVRDYP